MLSSNGLTDLLNIGGLRVAAELPSSLLPGETITVEVTGFTGDRINLHILPNVPSGTAAAVLRQPALEVQSAAATASAGPQIGGGPPATNRPLRVGAPTDDAGVVRRAAAVPGAASEATTVNGRFAPNAATLPITARSAAQEPAALRTIEARLATSQATTAPIEPPGVATQSKTRLQTPAAGKAPTPPVLPRPLIAPRNPALLVEAPPTTAMPAARGPAGYTEPALLLRALHLAVTPSNIAAARLALESPQKLPQALEGLDRALAVAGNSPHVATLRTLIAFLGRIDTRSPVLATQIEAFVDHVVTGREAKLGLLLAAQADASGARSVSQPPLSAAFERVAIRQAALDYDFKTQMLALGKDQRAGTAAPNEVTSAIGRALTAVTALQLSAATTLAAHPDGLQFVLPIALPNGFARAQVRIDRDLPQRTGGAIDGDNFHIAFVLETQHLGTVAIDLVTVGRAVSVSVKTEVISAQAVFGSALKRLTQRLEALRYRVASADATVAPRGIAPPQDVLPARPRDASRGVDLDA